MADVGGESGLALDPRLHGVGHLVERAGEPVEVGVGLGREPRVEAAGRDLLGGVGDLAERPEQPSARGEPEQARQDQRAGRAEREGGEHRRERPFGRAQRERLEVAGLVGGDRHADGDVVAAVDRDELCGRAPRADRVDQTLREVGDRVGEVGRGDLVDRRPRGVGGEVGEPAGLGAQVVVEEVADAVGIVGQHLAHVVGVDERLVLGGRRALVDQVVAGEAVGDADRGRRRRAGR